MTRDNFIEKAKGVHGELYDYSKVVYKNNKTKVSIVCETHGDFQQRPDSHMQGKGCKECNLYERRTTDSFINKAKEIYGETYDYSKTEYYNSNSIISIICSVHGEFKQKAYRHLEGRGCKLCSIKKRSENNSYGLQGFISKAIDIHGKKYDYIKVKYDNTHTKINIICPEHGSFFQKANNHLQGFGCPQCSLGGPSKLEIEVSDFLNKDINILVNNREVLKGKELDILIPNRNLAIEFNGLYWHSDKFRDKNYHLNKTLECQREGITLIHIFEDEWLYKEDIVKSRLTNLLGLTANKIYARKTEVREVPTKEKTKFLDENHIQGAVGSKVNLGLYVDQGLKAIMTFGKLRVNLGQKVKDHHWELLRFCNKLNTNVVGGASKLLKHFERQYLPKKIISYADRRWSQGGLYKNLGFEFSGFSKPNYFYVIGNNREGRFKYRKDILVSQGFDPKLSEREIMKERGLHRIYDCGNLKFEKYY